MNRPALRWGWAALILFLVLAPIAGGAQPPAPLPPAAQEALDKGIVAAKVPDYPLAIRYFEDARKLAPQAPIVFLNLGIAESKIAGRELRAMAWFGAYLAAYPDAPNATAVKEQLAALDVKYQSDISHLIKTVQDAAYQIPDYARTARLNNVGVLWVKAGDLPAAFKAADSHTIGSKSTAYFEIARAQAQAGDIAGAQKTADRIEDTFDKSLAEEAIAKAQADAGDFAGALKSVDLIKEARLKPGAQKAIAEIRAKAGTATTSSSGPATVSEWLRKLDDTHKDIACEAAMPMLCDSGLKTEPFLDLAAHLNSLPPSDVPIEVYDGLSSTAKTLLDAHRIIDRMLKQQTAR